MTDDRTMCVLCAWRQTCNKKFSMDGATTTRCPEYTRDITLGAPHGSQQEVEKDKKARTAGQSKE